MEISNGEAKQGRLRTMQRGVCSAAKTLDGKARELWGEDRNGNPNFRTALVTLTYRPDVEWSPLHVSALLKVYREWFRRRGQPFLFVWTVELQQRGIPHYHIVCWFPRGRGLTPPLPDKQGWWPHGMTNAVFARSPIGYIAKYASKSETKSGHHLPKNCRLWGYGGLKMVERAPIAYAVAPKWVKAMTGIDTHPVKRMVEIVEVGLSSLRETVSRVSAYVALATGFTFFSPYEYQGMGQSGIVLSHRGFVEVLSPGGDWFAVPLKRG
jgi:hypothetical protein